MCLSLDAEQGFVVRDSVWGCGVVPSSTYFYTRISGLIGKAFALLCIEVSLMCGSQLQRLDSHYPWAMPLERSVVTGECRGARINVCPITLDRLHLADCAGGLRRANRGSANYKV